MSKFKRIAIKFLTFLLSLLQEENENKNVYAKEEDLEDIGGGGIKNPKP